MTYLRDVVKTVIEDSEEAAEQKLKEKCPNCILHVDENHVQIFDEKGRRILKADK